MILQHSLELLKELSEIEKKIAAHKKMLELHQIQIEEDLLLKVYQKYSARKTE